MPKFRVIKSYESPYPNSIRFRKGEAVTIGPEYTDDIAWKDWFWCTGENGQQAWVPLQFLVISGKNGIVSRDYNARELNLKVGEILTVRQVLNGFVFAENAVGVLGWAPLKHLALRD